MYNTMWHRTQEALGALLAKDSPEALGPHGDQVFVFQMLATFYIKYVQIFRSLEAVYDQIVHPQKRLLIRKVLDAVMGRVLELKHEMVELELTEFHYFDDILADLKLAPQQLDIPVPKYFMKEKSEVVKEREKILAQIIASAPAVPDKRVSVKPLALEEAVRLVQVAERARQGRLRAAFMRQIFQQECRAKQARALGESMADVGAAALRIQKVWRGFHQCKLTREERRKELVFLGMAPPPLSEEVSAAVLRAEQVSGLRDAVQRRHEQSYRDALVAIKDGLRLVEGADIKDHLQDQIRRWFIECRNLTGAFPEYPDVEDGGSAVIFSSRTPQQVVEDIVASQEEEEKNTKAKKKEKKEKEKRGPRRKEPKAAPEKAQEENEGWKVSPSAFLSELEEGNNLYKDIWQHKNESGNLEQSFDPEMIKEEKRKELEAEIRVQVDELMRQELKNLKLAVSREKDGPVKARRDKKRKPGPREKKGKKGKDKDLTAGRTIESLYQELVEAGLLIQAPRVHLSDYIGEYCYLGTTLRQVAIEPMPSLLDVRQLITLYGILPLGSAAVHEKAPLVRSLLLAGPAGVGKKMLIHAICTETGANLFDLSAANVAGKYPGKSGLQMMLHLVFKVARQLQPSVVWIGDAEKTFYRKVPVADRTLEPKRLKKQLPRALRLLGPDDRVLVVGTSRRPFDAELQPFCRFYQKIILVPRPDYASRHVLWRRIIQRSGGALGSSLNVSCLAKLTDGFTPGHMVQAARRVLTERRLRQQGRKPLTAGEFIAALTSLEPVYQEEEDSFKNWYAKTPLGKRRARALTGGKAEKEKEKGKKKAKQGK